MDSFAKHMFTPAVQTEQEELGLKERFEHVYRNRFTGSLGQDMRAFIESRTHFYMATVSETGWPYVQHRGGPRGFIKFIDDETFGFADYTGNKQLISKGNLKLDDRVSIIFMDYVRQARLKVIGHMTMVNVDQNEALAEELRTDGPEYVERVASIKITAVDWNCPKYIEPRYTENEITDMIDAQLAARDQKINRLAVRLRELGEDPDII